MSQAMFDPHGECLRDYLNGKADAVITVHSENKTPHDVPASIFFRDVKHLLPLEDMALDLAVQKGGRVLDAGAGSGCHSLILQERGADVCAVDIVPLLVEVMKRREVRDARCADLFTFSGERFDTILMLMNGTVILERLERLGPFLTHLRSLLHPGGQLLLHSSDLRALTQPEEIARQQANRAAGRYFGEMWTQLEYMGKKGERFMALYLDPDTLAAEASKAGWSTDVLEKSEHGAYLARLTPRAP